MALKKRTIPIEQQDLLRHAMDELGLTRMQFAARLNVAARTLDRWLLPAESPDARAMSEMGKAYVREILKWHRKTS
jgi:DNA-binding transcriptional regulator YiaG